MTNNLSAVVALKSLYNNGSVAYSLVHDTLSSPVAVSRTTAMGSQTDIHGSNLNFTYHDNSTEIQLQNYDSPEWISIRILLIVGVFLGLFALMWCSYMVNKVRSRDKATAYARALTV